MMPVDETVFRMACRAMLDDATYVMPDTGREACEQALLAFGVPEALAWPAWYHVFVWAKAQRPTLLPILESDYRAWRQRLPVEEVVHAME